MTSLLLTLFHNPQIIIIKINIYLSIGYNKNISEPRNFHANNILEEK